MVLYYDCGDSWSLPCHLPCHPIFLSFRLTFFVPHVGAETITNGIPIDFLFQILFRVTSQCLPQIEEVRSGKGRGRGPNSQSVALAVSIWTEFLWEVWELPLGLRLLWPEGRWSIYCVVCLHMMCVFQIWKSMFYFQPLFTLLWNYPSQ